MSDTFNDGDPIDATLLQKLKTDVALATALAGAKVSAGAEISIENKGPADVKVPKFFGGRTENQTLRPGAPTSWIINYSGADFEGKPKSITLTPILKKEDLGTSIPAPSIVSGTVTEKTAEVQMWGVGNKSRSVAIFFIAVQN